MDKITQSPGDYIRELIKSCGKTVERFAKALEVPLEWAENLLNGDVIIDSGIAYELESLFGEAAESWLQREVRYRKECEGLGKDVWWSYDSNGKLLPPAYVRFNERGFWGVK